MNDSARHRVAIVSGTRVWPARDGGDLRIAAIARELAREHELHVARPAADAGPAPPGVTTHEFSPNPDAGALRYFASQRPRLGMSLLGGPALAAIAAMLEVVRPDAVYHAHSYLAAVAPSPSSGFTVVDFPNLESRRFASLAGVGAPRNRLSSAWEAVKARRWERAVARDASLCLAVTESDVRALNAHGAMALHVPNAAEAPAERTPSPVDGPALLLGSATYAPNRDAIEQLLRAVWPHVVGLLPSARLEIAGRGTAEQLAGRSLPAGVTVLGEVEDVSPLLRRAALVVAPVQSGGGSQLKVQEALAHGRVVAGAAYGARSVPNALRTAYRTADVGRPLADEIVRLLADVGARHELERLLDTHRPPSWQEACEPLLDALRAALGPAAGARS